MIDERTEDLASLYVMGLLTPEEARSFEARLAEPEVAGLVGKLEAGAAAFAWTAPPRNPPAEVKARLMREIDATKRIVPFPRPRPAWLPWAIAASLALTAGWQAQERHHLSGIVDDMLSRNKALQAERDQAHAVETALQAQRAGLEKQLANMETALGMAKEEVASLQARDALSQIEIATLGSMLQDNPKAVAVVAWDGKSQRGIVKMANMPEAGPDKDYQLWIIDPGYKQPVSAGVFAAEGGTEFKSAQPISKADKFAVSLEKKGGVASRQGPIVLLGE